MYSLDGAAVVLLSAALLSPVSSATVVQHPSQYTSSIPPPSIDQLACYNTVLTISCSPTAVLVFESARYGRNDTVLAARCAVPYTRHCDVDAHFLMNRACAGRRKCSLVVGAAVFGDPCGYEEFLRVEYRCVPVTAIYASCPSSTVPDRAAAAAADSSSAAAAGSSAASAAASAAVGPNGAPSVPAASATSAIQQAQQQQQQPSSSVLYGRGYLSSPSYPDRYYSDAECRWTLVVQRHQTIRVTIYDFELDIKKAGRCKDYLEITGAPPPPPDTGRGGVSQHRQFSSPGIPVYFRDCGALGRHTVDVESNRAVVRLVVDQSSLTQRGFFLYFEAMGPGCDDTPTVTTHAPPSPSNGGEVHVVYYFDDATTSDDVTGSDVRAGTLRANVSCVDERAVFAPTSPGRRGGSAAYRNAQKPMTSSISVYCSGTEWSEHIPTECVDADTIQQTVGNSPQELVPTDPTTSIAAAAAGGLFVLTSSASIIGIVLGGLSALLSVVLTLVIAIYCYSRRRRSSRKNSRQRLQQQQQQIVNNKWRSGASTMSASDALIVGGRHGRSREAASCRPGKSKTCAGDVIDTEAAISVAACRIQLQQQQQRPPDVCIGASQTLNPAGAGPQTVVRRTAVGCKICAAGNCSGSEYAWLPPPPPPPSGKHPYPGGNRPSETDVEYITTKTEVGGCSTATDVAYCPGCIYTVSAIHQQQQLQQQQRVGVSSYCNQLRRYPSSSSSNRRRSASRYTVVAPFVDVSDPFTGHSTSGLTGDRPPSRIRTLTRPSPPTGAKRAHAAPTPGPIVAGAVADGQSVIYCPDCAASDFCSEIGGGSGGHRDPYRRSVACSAPDLLFTISSNCSSEQQVSALMNTTVSGGACTDDTVLLPVCDCDSYTEDSCDCRLDDDVIDEHLVTDGTGTHLLSRGFNDETPDRRRQDNNGSGSGNGASDRKSSSGSFGNWSPFGRTVNTSV